MSRILRGDGFETNTSERNLNVNNYITLNTRGVSKKVGRYVSALQYFSSNRQKLISHRTFVELTKRNKRGRNNVGSVL